VGENPSLRSIWWKRADWFVFVPWFLVLASFWIYLAGPTSGPVAEAIHEFYGMRHTDEVHTPWVLFGSLLIFLYSFTLFLRGRLCSGWLQGPGRSRPPFCSLSWQHSPAWRPSATTSVHSCERQ